MMMMNVMRVGEVKVVSRCCSCGCLGHKIAKSHKILTGCWMVTEMVERKLSATDGVGIGSWLAYLEGEFATC